MKSDLDNNIESLENQIISLEVRIKRLEDYLLDIPRAEDYFHDHDFNYTEEAKKLVIENQTASISFLQRRMEISYQRASMLIDQLEKDGVVGPKVNYEPRKVLVNQKETE